MIDSIRVEGLKEFRRELKGLGGSWSKQLGHAGKKTAEVVAKATVASFRSLPGTASEVEASVKALTGSVRIGGANAPMALGSNFGSVRFAQFPPFLGKGQDYGIYKSIREKRGEIVDTYGDAVEDLAKRAFPS